LLGARVFEKHFTLDRSSKGTDHSFSLEPQGLSKLSRNLRRIPILLGSAEKKLLKNEIIPLSKMLKSIVASKELKKNTVLNINHLSFKSPGGGITPDLVNKIIGKKIKRDLNIDELILEEDLYE
jgi:sialic acid synthase SpsE